MRAVALGSKRALSKELGVSDRTLAGWLEGKLPKSWDEARVLRFASELYARSHEDDTRRSPAERAALTRALSRPEYSERAMVKAVARIEREVRKLDRELGPSQRRLSQLAGDIGVRPSVLRGWLRRGRVSESHMQQFDAWAEARADEEFREKVEKERARDLIEQAKQAAWAPKLKSEKGKPRRRALRAPDVKTTEGEVENDAHAGYSWDLRVEAWLSRALVERMAAWALGRARDTKNRRAANRWIVTALCSVLTAPGAKKVRSPGGERHFGRVSDRAFGSRLQIGAVFSSGTVHRGGLEIAVRRFVAVIGEQLGEANRVFVHGVVVRNWRKRTAAEAVLYRARERARYEREQAVLRARQARRKARASKSSARETRRKVSERRSTGKPARSSRGSRKRT